MWMRRPHAVSDANQGKRVLFLAGGARGEVQPIVALSAYCSKAGFEVLVVCTSKNLRIFEDFNVSVVDADLLGDLDNEDAATKNAADFVPTGAIEDSTLGFSRSSFRLMIDYTTDFRPELIIAGLPCKAIGLALAAKQGVPFMDFNLRFLASSGVERSPLGEPEGAPQFIHRLCWLQFHRQLWRAFKKNQLPHLQAIFESDVPLGWWRFDGYLQDCIDPLTPGLLCSSSSVSPVPTDAPQFWNASCQKGYVTVTSQEQLTKADQAFGCRDVLRSFCPSNGDDLPLYFGFAPYKLKGMDLEESARRLTSLSVEVAMRLNRKAVVLSGDAGLRVEFLGDREDLKAYAHSNVLFVGTAPHEFLFHKIAVAVHHGGVGTTACALRCGLVSLISPTNWEEHAQGDLVTRLKAGEKLGSPCSLTVSGLVDAISRCVSNQVAEKQNAIKDLRSKLQNEDGLKACIEHIDKFFEEEVTTGRWKQADANRRQIKAALRPRNVDCFSCWAFYHSLFWQAGK